MSLTSGEIIGCRDCGSVQKLPATTGGEVILCSVCDSELERRTGRRLDVALAFSATTFLLLLPANLLPFITTSLLGATRQSYLISSATSMWHLDWPFLSAVVGLFVVVFPLMRFGLLTFVLTALRFDFRPKWLGPLFRLTNELKMWAMSDVFLLALWVAYARLAATVATTLDAGAYCFIAAGLTTLFTRATLDRAAVWNAIDAGPELVASKLAGPQPVIACPSCELLVDGDSEGQGCPRCGARLTFRVPAAVSVAIALTLAGVLLYIPANIYPIATIPIGLTPTSYNVLGGVVDLFQAHLYGLGLLVFTASFAIPFIKLLGLSWCIASVLMRSTHNLRTKTRVYRLVEEIGRWSMVDPLVIACFVPVTQFNSALSSSADEAAPFFTLVVILTMLAARIFDPRLMWDVAATGPDAQKSKARIAKRRFA